MKNRNEKKIVKNTQNDRGRPREHDRDQIARDLIEWAKLSTSINLNGFCCSREPPLNPRRLADWAKECDNFRGAYEVAKAFLGNRREELLNSELLHVKAYDLNARTYDYFLKEEEELKKEAELARQIRLKEIEAKLRAQEAKDVTEQTQNSFNALMSQLDALQSERKIADNNSNNA